MKHDELVQLFKENGVSNVSAVGHHDIKNPFPGLGKWTEVDSYGGEGEGERWFTVIHFTEANLYINIDGYYTSYDGVSFDGWDCLSIVTPRQKTITVYE